MITKECLSEILDAMSRWQDTLPSGWHARCDQTSGKTYYYRHATGEVTWVRPTFPIGPRAMVWERQCLTMNGENMAALLHIKERYENDRNLSIDSLMDEVDDLPEEHTSPLADQAEQLYQEGLTSNPDLGGNIALASEQTKSRGSKPRRSKPRRSKPRRSKPRRSKSRRSKSRRSKSRMRRRK
jgi:hypothetical protein